MSEIEKLQLKVYENYIEKINDIETDLDNTIQTDLSIEKQVNGRPVLTVRVVDKLDAAIERLTELRDKAIMLDGLNRAGD
ncbi:hypothetical protein [Pediococcus parvulus]|uniref:hypothetical protein n=1 Tax=Pediococcus parvulus TaxID=54062 RepID=UPI00345F113F